MSAQELLRDHFWPTIQSPSPRLRNRLPENEREKSTARLPPSPRTSGSISEEFREIPANLAISPHTGIHRRRRARERSELSITRSVPVFAPGSVLLFLIRSEPLREWNPMSCSPSVRRQTSLRL